MPRSCGHLRPDDVAILCPVSFSGSQRKAHSELKESTNLLCVDAKTVPSLAGYRICEVQLHCLWWVE